MESDGRPSRPLTCSIQPVFKACPHSVFPLCGHAFLRARCRRVSTWCTSTRGTAGRVRGGTAFEKLRCRLGLAQESDAQTVGGWVAEQLGRIPRRGDRFTCGPFTVTVTAAEARRVSEIVLSRESLQPARDSA